MTDDRFLEAALRHEAEDIELDPETFGRIRDRTRRRIAMNAVLSVTTVAVVAVSALYVPSLLDRGTTDVVVPPTPTPSPSEDVACGDAPVPPKTSRGFIPESTVADGIASIPVTFPDGSTAVVEAPESAGVHELEARPDMSGGPQREWVRPAISFGGSPIRLQGPVDCIRGPGAEEVPVWEGNWLGNGPKRLLSLRFGSWYVQVVEERAPLGQWARQLHGEVTGDGWLTLRGSGTVKMGPQRDGGDSNVMFYDRDNILSIWVVECDRDEPEISRAFGSFCSGDGRAEIHVQGNPAFVRAVVDGLTVTDVEPAYPLDRYAIVP